MIDPNNKEAINFRFVCTRCENSDILMSSIDEAILSIECDSCLNFEHLSCGNASAVFGLSNFEVRYDIW